MIMNKYKFTDSHQSRGNTNHNVDDNESELSEPVYDYLTRKPSWKRRYSEHASICLSMVRRCTQGRYEDWLYLALLGFLMGCYSFFTTIAVELVHEYRMRALTSVERMYEKVLVWTSSTACISVCACLFVARFIPSAAGSGFPEIKAYLQGVKMPNTFSPLTCFGKLVFLPIMLCSNLPLGREGPVTHVAAVFALLITKVFKDVSSQELQRHAGNELVGAACTMGAAVCYGAPIGGVLFSIESTRTYFAVRNYWRGFFAAVVGTLMLNSFSQLYYHASALPIYPIIYTGMLNINSEIITMSIFIGLICGCLGSAFVYLHRHLTILVLWFESKSPSLYIYYPTVVTQKHLHLKLKSLNLGLSLFRFLHTLFVCFSIVFITFPWNNGYSPLMSHLSTTEQIVSLLKNSSWLYSHSTNVSFSEHRFELGRWTNNLIDYRIILVLYMLYNYFGTMICTTLSLPCGTLIPILKVGAALGRLTSEIYCEFYAERCLYMSAFHSGIACIFGAALCASVTHCISISVILFELTGQISFGLPILIAVLVSNALSRHVQPSLYDSIISVKKICVLPKMGISKICGGYSNLMAKNVMSTSMHYVNNSIKLEDLRIFLHFIDKNIEVIPLINENLEPLGLVHVHRLKRLLIEKVGYVAWKKDRTRFLFSVDAFRTKDWHSLIHSPAIEKLDLEVGVNDVKNMRKMKIPSISVSGDYDDFEQNDVSDAVRVDAYCTVHDEKDVKVRWDLARRSSKLPVRKEPSTEQSPLRSALRTTFPSLKHCSSSTNIASPLLENSATLSQTVVPSDYHRSRALSRFTVQLVENGSESSLMRTTVSSGADCSQVSHSCNQTDCDTKRSNSVDVSEDSGLGHLVTHANTQEQRKHLISSKSFDNNELSNVYSAGNNIPIENKNNATRMNLLNVQDLKKSWRNNKIKLRKMKKVSSSLDVDVAAVDKDSCSIDEANCTQSRDLTDTIRNGWRSSANNSILSLASVLSGLYNSKQKSVEVTQAQQNGGYERRMRRAWRRKRLTETVVIRDCINVDLFPLAVNVDTSLIELHKLFAMLCANKLYVMERRRLVGIITLQRFSQFITKGHIHNGRLSEAKRHSMVPTEEPVKSKVYNTINSIDLESIVGCEQKQETMGSANTLSDVDDLKPDNTCP